MRMIFSILIYCLAYRLFYLGYWCTLIANCLSAVMAVYTLVYCRALAVCEGCIGKKTVLS